MKKAIKINKFLFGFMLLINVNAVSLFAMIETRDMPDMALEKGKIKREENEREVSYIHHENARNQHFVKYNKATGQYSGYSHHIPSGRTKRMNNPEETFHSYKRNYHESNL